MTGVTTDGQGLTLSVTHRDKIHEGVSGVLREIIGVLAWCSRMFEYDFRLSRVQNTPRFLVHFSGCWRECVFFILIFLYVPNPFCAVLEKFSSVFSRCTVTLFPGLGEVFLNYQGC